MFGFLARFRSLLCSASRFVLSVSLLGGFCSALFGAFGFGRGSLPWASLASVVAFWLSVSSVSVLGFAWLLFFLLRSACFVRFPRPWSRFGWSCFAWRCVSVSALPALRASVVVARVLPAVVSRRSGVLCAVWVLVPHTA